VICSVVVLLGPIDDTSMDGLTIHADDVRYPMCLRVGDMISFSPNVKHSVETVIRPHSRLSIALFY
jgi:hypothetical protein